MSISIFFRPQTARRAEIQGITLDATLQETHSRSSTISLYPVESGTNITDHIVSDPEELTVQGFITDTPIEGGINNRSQDVFNQLNELMDRREPITVVSGLKVYESMAIRNLNIPRDRSTGRTLVFTIDLMRIRIAGQEGFFEGALSQALGGFSNNNVFSQARSIINLGKTLGTTPSVNTANKAANVIRSLF